MTMQVALVQVDTIWQDAKKNCEKFNFLLNDLPDAVDIVILPETFSTGFTMNIFNLDEDVDVYAFQWMQKKAMTLSKCIAGSVLTRKNGKCYNRMYWIRPDGSYEYYDKKHLFQMGNEHKIMTAGNRRVIVTFKGVKFLLQICYDLRFPVWSKNNYDPRTDSYDYDVMLYIANWPEARREAYLALLKARAIENQAYVLWVNRVGEDGKGISHSGDSQVIDPFGKTTAQYEAHKEGILYAEIDIKSLQNFRKEFQVGLDWDSYDLIIR